MNIKYVFIFIATAAIMRIDKIFPELAVPVRLMGRNLILGGIKSDWRHLWYMLTN